MKRLLAFPIIMLFLASCTTGVKEESTTAAGYATPESQGISSSAILQLVKAFEEEQPDAVHSIIVRRHNQVVAEGWWSPYSPDSPHLLWSLSKSFTSTAIGIAQDEGLLSIDDLVIDYFPEALPEEVSGKLEAMRISDLLRMNTGHQSEPSFLGLEDDNWARGFLEHEVVFKPGTHFLYNSMATYMCSAIIQKVSGMSTLDYLTPRLFEPMGINKPSWDSDPMGISVGGWGLSLKTEDISKFGQLLLQKGQWEGKQLVSAEWVKEATSLRTSNGSNPQSDWDQGYGYQFWQCRHNAFRGDGAFGQYCLVMPEQDAVIAITSGSGDLQGILNLVWEHLLPAMKDEALPEDPQAQDALKQKLESLTLHMVKGERSAAKGSEISGKTFKMNENALGISQVSLDFNSEPVQVNFDREGESYNIAAGYGINEEGTFPWSGLTTQKIAVNGAWTSENCYEMNLQYYESPQSMQFIFRFNGDQLSWETTTRASFAPANLGTINGRLAEP